VLLIYVVIVKLYYNKSVNDVCFSEVKLWLHVFFENLQLLCIDVHCVSKITSPRFLAVTRESIVRFM